MSRVRTGHKPSDWSLPDSGAYARMSGHSGASIHGELVQGESERDRQARFVRESKARAKERQS